MPNGTIVSLLYVCLLFLFSLQDATAYQAGKKSGAKNSQSVKGGYSYRSRLVQDTR